MCLEIQCGTNDYYFFFLECPTQEDRGNQDQTLCFVQLDLGLYLLHKVPEIVKGALSNGHWVRLPSKQLTTVNAIVIAEEYILALSKLESFADSVLLKCCNFSRIE